MKKNGLFFVAVVVSLLVTACGAINEKKNVEKYNAYIGLLNTLIGDFADNEQFYAENRMDEAGNFVPASEQNFSSIYDQVQMQDAITISEKALSSKPKMDIDDDVKVLIKALKEEVEIFDEIARYYNDKDFMNDNNAKGKKLHEKLMTAYKEVDAPAIKFYDEMQEVMEQENGKERMENKKEGNKISIALLDFLDAAEESSNLIYESLNEDGTVTVNAEQYAELSSKISETLDVLKIASEDQNALEKEAYDKLNIFLFMEEASKFKTSSEELYGNLGKETQTAAIDDFLVGYSKLVNEYNYRIGS